MIFHRSGFALVLLVILCGNTTVSLALGELDGQSSQDELSATKTQLQQAKQKIEELERQLKQRIGELVLQLHAKDNEVAALITNAHANAKQLREDLASRTEELNQAKRRIIELEQQLAASGKGQELVQAKRRATEAEQLAAAKEQELAQAKRRLAEVEQRLAATGKEQALAQAKRRVTDVEQHITEKEQELTQAKRRATEAEQLAAAKEQELAQAKRRLAEVEQQMAGKEQELTQAKRRATEAEQLTAAKEQELAQAKRRLAEADQQTAKKEQELAQVKEDLRQVTQKLADLGSQLTSKDAELSRTKQWLTELELNSSKPAVATPAQEESLPSLSLLPVDHTLSLTNPIETDPEVTDDGEAGLSNGDLGKIGESLANLLQPELKKGSATLRQRGNKLTLSLSTNELFSPGDATVTLGGTSLLERVSAVLLGFRYQSIEVAGHTDNTPLRLDPRKGFRDNIELSRSRAEHASQILISGGLEADRVKAVGYADSKPIATNETEKGRGKNRRMEIVITQAPESSGIPLGEGKTQAGKKLQDSPPKR
jgi:flagellar motor protein MotB